MNLRDFYLNTIQTSDYHYRFYEHIKNINVRSDYPMGLVEREDATAFEVYDIEESISKFKELCLPRNGDYNADEKCWFYLITYYLYKNGYTIKEFPKLLERPPDDPNHFACGQVRDTIFSRGDNDGTIVRWSARRAFISKLTFSVQSVLPGVRGTVKNIIFAAKYKPEIVFDDALNNDISITKNANQCLIYDRPISNSGLKWSELVKWYADSQGLTENQEISFCKRLIDSMDSEPEKKMFRAYYCFIHAQKGNLDVPALIPQVYLHYDPLTIKQRGYKLFEHQKMDFLMIFSHKDRVVIEIDGEQHYSESGKASPRLYAEMMKAHREMILLGYDVYRFGGFEFKEDQNVVIDKMKPFFYRLFKKYEI